MIKDSTVIDSAEDALGRLLSPDYHYSSPDSAYDDLRFVKNAFFTLKGWARLAGYLPMSKPEDTKDGISAQEIVLKREGAQ